MILHESIIPIIMLYYQLAGLQLGIICDDEYMINRMKPFETKAKLNIDMTIHVSLFDRLDEPHGEILIDSMPKLLRKPKQEAGYISYISGGRDGKTIIMTMDSNSDWSKVAIAINKNYYNIGEDREICEHQYQFAFCGIAFRNMLMHREGLIIHSSSIAFRDKGIIFTAPSGTGKSTHVSLWEEAFKGEVVVANDDTPAVRIIGDVPVLFGTPWSGSSDKYANIQVPLKTIVVLEQHSENMIRKISPLEALPKLIPGCFLPYFDRKTMIRTYDMILKLLTGVDVYHLRCLPNQEAVEMVYQCIL